MNILVCVKQVRESAEVGASWILNPSDGCALEAALSLRGAEGCVTVLAMGRPQTEAMLRELLARGADRAVFVTDPAYAGSDTLATARVLAQAARHTGPYDCIFTGRRAVDGETAETPARLAQLLSLPILTDVARLTGADACETEQGSLRQTCRFTLPALLTFREGGKPLRPMSILGMRKARQAEVLRLTNRELNLPAEQCGLNGSPTKVIKAYEAEESTRHVQFLSSGAQLLEAIRDALSRDPLPLESHCEEEQAHLSGEAWVLCEQADEDAWALCGRAIALSGGARILEAKGSSPEQAARRIREGNPAAVFCPSTPFMRVFASQTATLLQTGLTADCTGLSATEEGLLLQTRPTFGGAQMAQIICPQARPQMALVRGGVMEAFAPTHLANVERLPQAAPDGRVRVTKAEPVGEQVNLRNASLIVAGGLGVGSREGFDGRLRPLTARLGGECAATRSAVDAGYAPYALQVGQTGLTVQPRVYLAVGVSGAIQHLLGMRRSGTVLAINTDPKAPIFRCADYGVVGDWRKIFNELEEALS